MTEWKEKEADVPFIEMDDWGWVDIVSGVRAKTPHVDKIMLSYVEFEAGADVPDHSYPHEQACRKADDTGPKIHSSAGPT
jgi:quercetin dioxygenase-like cupin family protein